MAILDFLILAQLLARLLHDAINLSLVFSISLKLLIVLCLVIKLLNFMKQMAYSEPCKTYENS